MRSHLLVPVFAFCLISSKLFITCWEIFLSSSSSSFFGCLWTLYGTLHFMHGIIRKWRIYSLFFFSLKKFRTNWNNCTHIGIIMREQTVCMSVNLHRLKSTTSKTTNERRRIQIIISITNANQMRKSVEAKCWHLA